MTNLLIVPIYLDALVLDKPTAVVEAFADFSRLPYFDGQRDVNPEVPNISEEILSQPFQNQNLYLERGVHLHWAMPDALSRGRKVSDKTDFPTLPNRWLVSRIRNQIIETQWVVESDYLYPYLFSVELQYISELDTQKVSDTLSALFKQNGQTLNKATAIVIESGKKWMVIDEDQTYFISKEAGTLNIYLRSNADTDSNARIAYPASIDPYRPFGYLGRCLELKAWQNETNKSKNIYLDKLTAVGYGEPAFAAFYPNCHSVFGFWDDTATDTNGLRGAAYEVLGWYSNSDQDSLSLWTGKTLKDEVASLLESNKWQVVKPSDDDDPVQRMVCFGRINFDNSAKFDFKLTEEKNVAIAVGNTSTEALSAHLAAKLGTDKTKSIIEDQLEALHLAAGLEKRRLDIGPKFTEARHAKGFRPVPAGYIWTLRPESNQQPDQVVNQSDQVTLPPELAEHLNTLNDLQQAYDQADFEIESLRSQLFTDWYKYMLCAYPPLDTPDDYPNIDEVKQFIEVNYLDDQAPLQQKIAKVGKLHLDKGLGAAKQPVLHAVNQLLMKSDISDWDGFVSTLDQSSLLAINYSPLPPTQTILKDREEKIASLLKDLNHQFFQNEGSASQVFYRRIKSNGKNLSAESTKLVSGAKVAPQHINN